MSDLVTRREWFRSLCASMGMPKWVAELAFKPDVAGRPSSYWDELVDAETGEPERQVYVWVQRNHDKPHRCPVCHRVVTWDRAEYGPRTRLRCSRCGVQWRSGVRVYPWPLRALRRR